MLKLRKFNQTPATFLISRDKRTHDLFRSSWIEALNRIGIQSSPFFRTELVYSVFMRPWKIVCLLRLDTIVFGVVESILFSFTSPRIIVITGFGRLFSKKRVCLRKFIICLLLWLYRNKIVVCLNSHDERILNSVGFNTVVRIHGEGIRIKEHSVKKLPQRGDLVYLGRLLKSKGVDTLLKAILELQELGSFDRKIWLIGDTDYSSLDAVDADFLNKCKLLLGEKLIIEGYQSDINKYSGAGIIFVSLSEREGMPFAALEALFLGSECVLSNVAGHRDLGGIESVTLVSSIKEFKQMFVRENMGRNANNTSSVLAKYSYAHVVDEIQEKVFTRLR